MWYSKCQVPCIRLTRTGHERNMKKTIQTGIVIIPGHLKPIVQPLDVPLNKTKTKNNDNNRQLGGAIRKSTITIICECVNVAWEEFKNYKII